MPNTKRRSDESDLEESRGERDGDWAWENHLWPDDLPDADEVGFCENVAVAHDACIDALSELEDLNTGDGFACLEAGIERLAHVLGTEEAGGEVDLKTVQGVEDVLRWLQRSRRLMKQLQTAEAVDQMEQAVTQLRDFLDDLGWSAPNEHQSPDDKRFSDSSVAGPRRKGLVRLSDDVSGARENLSVLQAAILEAHARDEQFSEAIAYKIGDLRRELDDAQARAEESMSRWHGESDRGSGDRRTSGEDGVDSCPRYITHDRDGVEDGEFKAWEPSTPYGRVERAHDEVRGALSELQKDNHGAACNLLLSAIRTITVAVDELDEQARQRLYHEGHEATDYDALVARSVDEVAEEMGVERISFQDDPEEAEEFALRLWRRWRDLKGEAED